MEIKKKDYTRIYDLILAELEEKGYHEMVSYLEENPPKKNTNLALGGNKLYSIDLAHGLVEAKEQAGPQLSRLDLTKLDSLAGQGNHKVLINNIESKWFKTLKSMGGNQATRTIQIYDINLDDLEEGDNDPEDNCQCWADNDCEHIATWKNPNTGVQLCDIHFNEEVDKSSGEHGFQPWDCETDEYYKYREDLG